MSASPSTSSTRPRTVDLAFWTWLLAAVMLVTGGLLLAFTDADVPTLLRISGVVNVLAGLALAYLARRARGGDVRFRRAAIALALSLTLLLALFALISQGLVWLVTMVLTTVGGVLIMRPSAQEWFRQQQGEKQQEAQ